MGAAAVIAANGWRNRRRIRRVGPLDIQGIAGAGAARSPLDRREGAYPGALWRTLAVDPRGEVQILRDAGKAGKCGKRAMLEKMSWPLPLRRKRRMMAARGGSDA
jgi:hypothetical protein